MLLSLSFSVKVQAVLSLNYHKVQDTARAKEILGATATLEFREVDDRADLAAAASGRAPAGSEIKQDRDGRPVVLKKRVILGVQVLPMQALVLMNMVDLRSISHLIVRVAVRCRLSRKRILVSLWQPYLLSIKTAVDVRLKVK